jgi:hypothetical protein
MLNTKTFDYFITKNLNHHLSNERNDGNQKSPCCRRKTKTITQDKFMHSRQPLPLIKQTNSYTDINTKQFSENNLYRNDYQS